VRPQAQPFGLRRRGPPAPARRLTRPPVWRFATLEPWRAAATQRGVCGDAKQALSPLLRQFNLSLLRIETAGQSPNQAHTMQLVGIVDAHALRAEILRCRERLRIQPAASSDGDGRQAKLLEEIRDRLDEIAGLLRKRG
jgi:hypothetical protein